LGLECRQDREPSHPRRLARLLQAEVGADLARDPPLSVLRAVPADPDEVAVDDAAEVVPYGREHRRQHDPQLPHPLGDHSAPTSRGTRQSSHSVRSTVTTEHWRKRFRTEAVLRLFVRVGTCRIGQVSSTASWLAWASSPRCPKRRSGSYLSRSTMTSWRRTRG